MNTLLHQFWASSVWKPTSQNTWACHHGKAIPRSATKALGSPAECNDVEQPPGQNEKSSIILYAFRTPLRISAPKSLTSWHANMPSVVRPNLGESESMGLYISVPVWLNFIVAPIWPPLNLQKSRWPRRVAVARGHSVEQWLGWPESQNIFEGLPRSLFQRYQLKLSTSGGNWSKGRFCTYFASSHRCHDQCQAMPSSVWGASSQQFRISQFFVVWRDSRAFGIFSKLGCGAMPCYPASSKVLACISGFCILWILGNTLKSWDFLEAWLGRVQVVRASRCSCFFCKTGMLKQCLLKCVAVALWAVISDFALFSTCLSKNTCDFPQI